MCRNDLLLDGRAARRLALAVVASMSAIGIARAAELGACAEDAIIVLDSSGSMAMRSKEPGALARYEIAREAARKVVPAAARVRNLGLLVYGPGSGGRCSNIALAVPPRPDAAAEILSEIERTKPAGETPLSAAVEAAAETLDYRHRPATIVLLTDGAENCGRNPCELARTLHAEARQLTIHIIGFRLGFGPRLRDTCLAEQNNGMFVLANTVEELTEAMSRTLTCAQMTFDGSSAVSTSRRENTDRSTSR